MPKEYIKFYDHEGMEIKLEKTIYKVCPRCKGKGSHVNPNVDGHGLSQESFEQDPDFYGDYMSGVYDVDCYECGGKRVIKVVDWSIVDDALRKAYDQYRLDEWNYQQECEAERRMGA